MHQVTGNMTTPVPAVEADLLVKPAPVLPDAVPLSFPGIPPTIDPALPKMKQPTAQPQGILSNNVSVPHAYFKRITNSLGLQIKVVHLYLDFLAT